MKRRPPYYSKLLALCSLLRAWQDVRSEKAELIFLNDGPIPADRLQLMQTVGEVVAASAMGNKGSINKALAMPIQRRWPDSDLVWFAEDDYLYLPYALGNLLTAADNSPEFQYFGLYALIGDRQPNGKPHIDSRVPPDWRESEPKIVDGHAWRAALSTTSTFGARVGAIRADRLMMRIAMETGGAFDHTISLAYQGFDPLPTSFLMESVQQAEGVRAKARAAALAAARRVFAGYLHWRRRSASPHRLLAADPALISHMEIDNLALGTDWAEVAANIRKWAIEKYGADVVARLA